jgi:hypothetical protein
MELSAKLYKILPPESIETKTGNPLKKQLFVVETQDQYPKKICFEVINDRINFGNLAEGMMVKVFFDPESREWQGKWFTSLRAWRLEVSGTSRPDAGSYVPGEAQAAAIPSPSAGESFDSSVTESDDLPF